MKTLTGHLTAANKRAIRAIKSQNLLCGKVGKITYHLQQIELGTWLVKMTLKDRGLIPCPGSELRTSTYTATFEL